MSFDDDRNRNVSITHREIAWSRELFGGNLWSVTSGRRPGAPRDLISSGNGIKSYRPMIRPSRGEVLPEVCAPSFDMGSMFATPRFEAFEASSARPESVTLKSQELLSALAVFIDGRLFDRDEIEAALVEHPQGTGFAVETSG